MRTIAHALAAAGTLAALACQNSAHPLSPAAIEPAAALVPAASAAACPCWDEGLVGTAFPAVHFHLAEAGVASLTRLEHESAQQIQALVRLADDGTGSCELATFGTEGRVEALAAAASLSAAECEACAALLETRAAAAGFAFRPTDGGEALD